MGCGTGGEHREAVLQVLAGRQPLVLPPAAPQETAGEKSFAHVPYLLALSLAILLPWMPVSAKAVDAGTKAKTINRRRHDEQNQHNQDNDAFYYYSPPIS
jgi:hypothetical protein